MMVARTRHAAVSTPNGRVAFFGGITTNGLATSSVETFDPSTGQFTFSAVALTSPRARLQATLVGDARILVSGGFNGATPSTAIQVFDASGPALSPVAPVDSLVFGRGAHVATRLAGGTALVAGGTFGSMPGEIFYSP